MHRGATVGRRTLDREVTGSIPGRGVAGKLFTPTYLDADSLRYYMESLNRVSLPFMHRLEVHCLTARRRRVRFYIAIRMNGVYARYTGSSMRY